MHKLTVPAITTIGLFFIGILAASLGWGDSAATVQIQDNRPYLATPAQGSAWQTLTFVRPPLSVPDTQADVVYVLDLSANEVLYAKNETKQRSLASLTKVMTAIIAIEYAADDTPVTITPQAQAQQGSKGMRTGDVWNMKDLVGYMLATSSNDAAYAIQQAVSQVYNRSHGSQLTVNSFVKLMNDKAMQLGMTETLFLDAIGFDDSRGLSGSYSTAVDMAKLFDYAIDYHPDIFALSLQSNTVVTSQNGRKLTVFNTNKAINDIPGLLAQKTGYTSLADGNLGFVFTDQRGHDIVVIIKGSGLQGRFSDAVAIVNQTLIRAAQSSVVPSAAAAGILYSTDPVNRWKEVQQ